MPTKTEINRKSLDLIRKIKKETVTLRWTIENFTEAYSSEDKLESEEFDLESASFALVLRCPELDNDDFSFYLLQYYEGSSIADVECKAWLEDLDGNKYYESKFDYSEEDGDFSVRHYFGESLRKRDLDTFIKLKNDTAIFCCEVKNRVPGEGILLPKTELKLRQKLWNSYQEGLTGDIIIQVEDKEFKISKNILVANSDVFERMLLTKNCKEVQEGVIEIKEVSYEIMKVFVEYLHRGHLDNLRDVCDELFVLAHKYLVVSLQKNCAEEMVDSLNKENLFSRLQLGFIYNQQNLKDAVIDYVTSKNSDLNVRQIMNSDEWHKLVSSNGLMANEITNAFFDKIQLFPEQGDDSVLNKRQKLG